MKDLSIGDFIKMNSEILDAFKSSPSNKFFILVNNCKSVNIYTIDGVHRDTIDKVSFFNVIKDGLNNSLSYYILSNIKPNEIPGELFFSENFYFTFLNTEVLYNVLGDKHE